MGAVVVVGTQWGDEGKGKIVDLYSQYVDLVVRYSGGANAGHTMVVGGEKLIFHLIPCGALHPRVLCILGQGMVLDPAVLLSEINELRNRNLFESERLLISDRAHLVLPQHMLIDELRERGNGAIGTTKRGIGPAYEDKVARRGLRVGDLLSNDKFKSKLQKNLDAWVPTIERLQGKAPHAAEILDVYMKYAEVLKPLIGSAVEHIDRSLTRGDKILLEGAQGTMLDIDSGTYPFVTSSSTVAGSACIGAGIGPTNISAIVGIAKAYTTRVGNGPFPSEIHGESGAALREAGAEYGATTGRPRRCGWLDIPVLKYARRLNGLTGIALTKIDVLTGLKQIQICTAYKIDDQRKEFPPYDNFEEIKPIYETMPGWDEPLGECRRFEDLPKNAQRYIQAIEQMAGCSVWTIGVGPGRDQTIVLKDPFNI